jgi:hypothetical protein
MPQGFSATIPEQVLQAALYSRMPCATVWFWLNLMGKILLKIQVEPVINHPRPFSTDSEKRMKSWIIWWIGSGHCFLTQSQNCFILSTNYLETHQQEKVHLILWSSNSKPPHQIANHIFLEVWKKMAEKKSEIKSFPEDFQSLWGHIWKFDFS